MKDLLRFFPGMGAVSCIALLVLGANLFVVYNVLDLDGQQLVVDLERSALEKDKENYKEFQTEARVLAKKLLEASAKLHEVRDTLTKEQTRLDAVAVEYDATLAGTKRLQQDARDAEERLKEARTLTEGLAPKIRTLEGDKNKLEASIAALQEQQTELEKQKEGLEREARTLQAALGRLEGQLEAKQTAVAELDKETKLFNSLTKKMTDLIENLDNDRANASALVADMGKALEEVKQQNTVLAEISGGDLAKAAANMKLQAEEIGNDTSDVKKASDLLTTTTTDLASLASSLDAQKARIDESIANLEKVNGLLDDDKGLMATQTLLAQLNDQLGDLLASVERERMAAADKASAKDDKSASDEAAKDAKEDAKADAREDKPAKGDKSASEQPAKGDTKEDKPAKDAKEDKAPAKGD